MDPNACVADFLFRRRARTECERDYWTWLRAGGFKATVRLVDVDGFGVIVTVSGITAKDRKISTSRGRFDADSVARDERQRLMPLSLCVS